MIFWIEAGILCLIFTAMVVPSVLKNPLAWASDYPPAIAARCRELGLIPREQRAMPPSVIARKVIFSLFAAGLLAVILVVFNKAQTFTEGFLLAYALWLVVDWYDALVLDCLWLAHSKKVIIPGTEDLVEAYHDYGFHLKMSAIGMVIGLPVCLLAGLGVYLLQPIL